MRRLCSPQGRLSVAARPARYAPPAAMTVLLALAVLAVTAPRAFALTEDEMYAAWSEAARQFEVKHPPLPPGSPEGRWVQGIGDRIVEAWPDRRWVSHQFLVVREDAPEAWSFPLSPVTHKVYVSTGLVQFIERKGGGERDDLLAGVLGHEIAHLMRDHHLLRQRQAETLSLQVPKDLIEWPARVLGKWQREDELEADKYGALYALHAGYHFEGIIDFLGHFLRAYGDGAAPGATGGAHPSLMARIAALDTERAAIEATVRLFDYGLDLLRVGAWEAARTCFLQVRNTFRMSPTVVHDLAYAELRQYEASLPEGPPLAQCLSVAYATHPAPKGGAAGAPELLEAAKRDFATASDLDRSRGFVAPRVGLAVAYLYQEDDARARAALQEVQVGLDNVEYLTALGVMEERAGDRPAARRAYCKALGVEVNAEAQTIAQQALQNARPHLAALYNLARLLESEGEKGAAAPLYRRYLAFEGSRSEFGRRAREALLRCGGQPPAAEAPGVVDSYREIKLGASGRQVTEAALGKPDQTMDYGAAGAGVSISRYASQGTTVLFEPDSGGFPTAICVVLEGPNQEAIAGVRLGDTGEAVEKRLGKPRQVVREGGGSEWWDYAPRGLGFLAKEGRVTRCLIGGRR
jgi:Zn-dependent protease with chaperone function